MCAVVGVFGVPSAARAAYLGLFSMQHRGQEAAGISSSNGKKIYTFKDRGLVSQIFTNKKLDKLAGEIAIGHNRYSTAGEDSILDAQPVFARYDLGEMSIVHNGNLVNAKEIRAELIKSGAIFQSSMDTENLAHLISRSEKTKLKDRIVDAVSLVKGAYSFIFLSRSKMFAIRDAHGFRPLVLGRIGKDGWMVASETCALDLAGAKFVREVEPGEMLIFEEGKEPQSQKIFEATPKKCIFEHVYFARPDTNLFGMSAYATRVEMGKLLSHEMPVEADIVIPVPDSGLPSALGYSRESGIPFELGIIRNHYVGRTFIEPAQEVRDLKVRMKLSPIKELISGKVIIVVDDSIVRGTTSKQIVRMLKDAGAKEVHMRISSPPTSDPCYYGIDTPDKSHLISSSKTVADVSKYIGADSLAYLSVEHLIQSVHGQDGSFCTACFSGEYPVKV